MYLCKVSLLDKINSPSDLRKLSSESLPQLAQELRQFIIEIVATKEGHLGASLGVVELSIALHYVFNTPDDLLVWDVGHQAYGHKILTGRKAIFHTNRQLGGISGFPKREESIYDTFGVGHSSTSISAALGMAMASQLKNEFHRNHIAVVGDASIASGMAFEALNHAGSTNANLLIILNDNAIGIDPSIGALKDYFTKVKTGKESSHNNFFETLNLYYSGPIDGHDLEVLLSELSRMKELSGPKLLHVTTTKGKGLRQAEENQTVYHAPGKFDAVTGDLTLYNSEDIPPKFQDVFGLTLVELAKNNEKIIGITPAMPTGSSLKYMMEAFPERAFDVGIAEQHAVTFAAGLATQDFQVFCTIYSTFLQRAYDQLIHDVCLQKIPVIFCVDRAGIVGEDGATHHGVFDLAYLNCIPNIIIAAPEDGIALRNLMFTAQKGLQLPLAIRYPRGRGTLRNWQVPFTEIPIGKGVQIKSGKKTAVLVLGTILQNIKKAVNLLPEKQQETFGIFAMRFLKPLDTELLHCVFSSYENIITVEEGTIIGGLGSSVQAFATENNYANKIKVLGIPDRFQEHGTTEQLLDLCGLSPSKLANTLSNFL